MAATYLLYIVFWWIGYLRKVFGYVLTSTAGAHRALNAVIQEEVLFLSYCKCVNDFNFLFLL